MEQKILLIEETVGFLLKDRGDNLGADHVTELGSDDKTPQPPIANVDTVLPNTDKCDRGDTEYDITKKKFSTQEQTQEKPIKTISRNYLLTAPKNHNKIVEKICEKMNAVVKPLDYKKRQQLLQMYTFRKNDGKKNIKAKEGTTEIADKKTDVPEIAPVLVSNYSQSDPDAILEGDETEVDEHENTDKKSFNPAVSERHSHSSHAPDSNLKVHINLSVHDQNESKSTQSNEKFAFDRKSKRPKSIKSVCTPNSIHSGQATSDIEDVFAVRAKESQCTRTQSHCTKIPVFTRRLAASGRSVASDPVPFTRTAERHEVSYVRPNSSQVSNRVVSALRPVFHDYRRLDTPLVSKKTIASIAQENKQKRSTIRIQSAKNDGGKLIKTVSLTGKHKKSMSLQIHIPHKHVTPKSPDQMSRKSDKSESFQLFQPTVKLVFDDFESGVDSDRTPPGGQSTAQMIANKVKRAKPLTRDAACAIKNQVRSKTGCTNIRSQIESKIRPYISRGMKEKQVKKNKNKLKNRQFLSPGRPKPPQSPITEVAKWNPLSVTGYTRPYYEAWVDTTLTAISRDTGNQRVFSKKDEIIRSLQKILESDSREFLTAEDLKHEKYAGRIKVRQR